MFLAELLGVLRELGSPRWVAETLELIAIVVGPTHPAGAATLLGSAIAVRGTLHEEGGLLAALAERLRACSSTAAATLGAVATAEHHRRGAGMHLDEVFDYARSELRANEVAEENSGKGSGSSATANVRRPAN